ncbi:MAG TPA: hypothetical protein VFZ65_11965 [Planctomycetota bacterium]|nr:hypothetical protein [Planctomycetota bacterium]
MTSHSKKQLRQLDTLEAAFRRELVERLRACAAGNGTLLFLVSPFRPVSWPSVRCDDADELFAAPSRIVACGPSTNSVPMPAWRRATAMRASDTSTPTITTGLAHASKPCSCSRNSARR